MAERAGSLTRPTRMRLRRSRSVVLGAALALPLILAGCGDQTDDRAASSAPSRSSSTSEDDCWERAADAVEVAADLDGDRQPETVTYAKPTQCPGGPALHAVVGDTSVTAPVAGDLPVGRGGIEAVAVPGRTGEILLVEQHHPRGGFQARLYGYAQGKLEELTLDGQPILGFVATDATTDPTSAACTDGGFTVTRAVAHQPIGVVPAWDVERTTYAVDGNTVTKGATTEIADNVLDRQLASKYTDLVHYRLFQNCLVDR